MDNEISKASFYFISPFQIKDRGLFLSEFEKLGWQSVNTYSKHSVTKEMATFLGWEQNGKEEFPNEKGFAFQLNRFSSNIKELKSLNGKLVAINRKNSIMENIGETFEMDSIIRLHLSPGYDCGLIIIKFLSSKLTLEEAANFNYYFHKKDRKQSLRIMRKPSRLAEDAFQKSMEESKTISELLELCLPDKSLYYFENQYRFITATCLLLKNPPASESEGYKRVLTQIAMAKNAGYQLAPDTTKDVLKVFDNIWAYASIEGFAVLAFEEESDITDDTFIKNFTSTFEVSYLPNYLLVLLVESLFMHALRNIDEVSVNLHMQDRLRTARLILTLSTSHYDHLKRLIEFITSQFLFDKKYTFILESIQSRKEEIERNANVREEKYEKNINLLIGIIGIGQVIFAIIELIGVNTIFGVAFAEGLGAWWIAMLSSIIFLFLIAGALIYIAWGQKR